MCAMALSFLAIKIKRGNRPLRLPQQKIRSGIVHGQFYAYPRQKSIDHFKEQIRSRTFDESAPVSTMELIAEVNPVIRGWGLYYCKAHVRRLFHRLDGWIVRRIWSHRYKRWRCQGWKTLPTHQAVWRDGSCESDFIDTFIAFRQNASLCESWMRENCTSSLSGGRRPALYGAPPPTRHH